MKQIKMVKKRQTKRQRDIKTKLMAAICMLLVSSIMMVSTTYAWFTLSTAPEVTGITTAVGANGNLEMALLPANGNLKDIDSAAGDSMAAQAAVLANVTWGNLVDLSVLPDGTDNYGLSKITLYPSALNVATWDDENLKLNPTQLADAFLQTPAYGADGRVSELKADTVTSTYDFSETNFPQNDEFGVRAVGTASGMTDRQLAYRNHRSAASTAMAQAKNFASSSLNTNGASLANIAIAHAVNSGATHTQTDVASLKAIVTDLLGDADTTGVLQYVENAYIGYIIAAGAAGNSGMSDAEFNAYEDSITALTDNDSDGTRLDEVKTFLDGASVTMPATLNAAIDKLIATRGTVQTAQNQLNALTGDDIAWAEISEPLYLLADVDAMTVCGVEVSKIKENMQTLVDAVLAGEGVNVVIASGGGVYADVADHCGDFSASITLNNISYGGMHVNEMTARMVTDTDVDPVYLAQLAAAVTAGGAPSSVGGQTMPISDMYGYIIDLAFRTNATGSNLLLQQDGVDRIYSDNTSAASETMGHGSSMTFTSTTTDFTIEQMKGLMGAIRIVFFNPNTKAVLATAKLDIAGSKEIGGTTVEAKLYLYEVTAGGAYVEADYDADADDVTYYTLAVTYPGCADPANATEQLYIKNAEGAYVEATYAADSGVEYFTKVETYSEYTADTAPADDVQLYVVQEQGEVRLTDNAITALNQGEATAVSVLVYLDGNSVENSDVAATAATSMTGTMNLQFASSAALVPMDYTPLMPQGIPAETTTPTPDDENP